MIKFLRLNENAKLPRRASDGSAGFDLYATDNYIVWAGAQCKIPTGIACELPAGYCAQIWPRSGMALKNMINRHAGLIDQDYRGEINVCLINHGDRAVEIKKGDRIAQMVVMPFLSDAVEVEKLDDTERGVGGFGSTGV